MHHLPPVAALLATLLLPLTASALTIDDFSGSTQSVTDSVAGGGAASSEEAHSVLGGSRAVFASQVDDAGSMTTSAGGGTGSFSHSGDGFGVGGFYYDGVLDGTYTSKGLNVDLIQGGTLNRFQIEVLSVSGSVGLQIVVHDADTLGITVDFAVPTPGTYEVPFSAFPLIDFTDIRQLSLRSDGLFSGEENVVLNSFSVVAPVPESPTALLLAAGLCSLAVRRRSAGAS